MEHIWELTTESPEQTEAFGEKLAAQLKGGEVIALFGGLGITDQVSSPTFALVHEYQGRLPLYHFDMYRVNSWDDLYSTGFFDYLDLGAVLVTEWSENIEAALPEEAWRITIRPGKRESQRVIQVEGVELS